MIFNLFNNVTTFFIYKSYIQFMYKQVLALNSLQGLICYKIQPTLNIAN